MDDGSGTVRYELEGRVATVTMDDGRANALSPTMQTAIHVALDRADADEAAVVLAGRDGRFSAGFDLQIIAAGGVETVEMVIGGFELATRLLERPFPTLIACTGHAMAMGAFTLLAGDLRVGADGPFKIAANEVAIGMTMPHTAIELMRFRLTPSAVQRSAVLAETFDPAGAVIAGYLDRVAPADQVVALTRELAAATMMLDARAHRATKQRLRAPLVEALRTAIERDRDELMRLFT